MNEEKINISDVERQGWSTEQIVRESSNKEPDETVRQILRGDESKGDPDERDLAGGPDPADTPHGREESKEIKKT